MRSSLLKLESETPNLQRCGQKKKRLLHVCAFCQISFWVNLPAKPPFSLVILSLTLPSFDVNIQVHFNLALKEVRQASSSPCYSFVTHTHAHTHSFIPFCSTSAAGGEGGRESTADRPADNRIHYRAFSRSFRRASVSKRTNEFTCYNASFASTSHSEAFSQSTLCLFWKSCRNLLTSRSRSVTLPHTSHCSFGRWPQTETFQKFNTKCYFGHRVICEIWDK